MPPSHILNGWISALWGLWEAGLALDDRVARAAFEAGVETLLAYLPAYDVGWWTRYSLFPGPLEDLAKPEYHRLHADQMRILGELTGVSEFTDTSARWDGYESRTRRAAVLAQKAAFAAIDGLK